MHILSLAAILLAAVCLTANASAIKGGHVKPPTTDEATQARSVKLAPALAVEKQQPVAQKLQTPAVVAAPAPAPVSAPVAVPAPVQAPVVAPLAILESTKRIYNDESIRRLAPLVADQVAPAKREQAPVVAEKPAAAAPVVVAAPVEKPVEKPTVNQAPVVAKSPEPVVVEQPQSPVKPVVVAVAAAPVAPVVVAAPAAVVEPKSAAPEPVVVAQKTPAEELPPQSDRSASSVVVVEHVVKAQEVPVVPQRAPAVAAPAPAVVPEQQPVVPVQVVPVAVPAPAVAAAPAVEESVLQARKEEAVGSVAAPVAPAAETPIEIPAPDPGLVLSEPIDSTTKLLIDLDEHVQKFLPAEEQQQPAQAQKDQVLVAGVDYSPASQHVAAAPASPTGKSSGPLVPYASVSGAEDAIVPPLPSLDGIEKASAVGGSASPVAGGASAAPGSPASASSVAGASPSASGSSSTGQSSATRQANHQNHNQQIVMLQGIVEQLDALYARIQETTQQLVARRRYVMSALLRPMGTYVRRVRTNLERLQTRINQLQAAASSVGGGGANRPGSFVDAAAIEALRKRIEEVSKRIGMIVNDVRFSMTPTSAPLNSNGR